MLISVIVPIRDGIDSLRRCLASLKQSDFPRFEVIVVDDCSKEDCSELVRSYGFKATRLNKPRGAWYARNKGAQLAAGDILVFIDSDMVIQPDALHRIYHQLSQNRCAAISGICGSETKTKNLVTWYKNLWMYYSYTNSPEDFDWFISGIGAVKREVFFALKGFDTTFQVRTGGGDLEFGRRVREAGNKIFLDKGLRVQHLKRYSLSGLLRNDYNRSKGWFRLVARKRMIPQVMKSFRIANIYPGFIISVLVSLLLVFFLLLSPFLEFSPYVIACLATAYVITNYRLFHFLRREGGFGFLLKAIPLSFVDHLVSGFGVLRGCSGWLGSMATRWFQKMRFRAQPRKEILRVGRRENR